MRAPTSDSTAHRPPATGGGVAPRAGRRSTLTPMATREINTTGLVDGDFLRYDDEAPGGDGEFKRQGPVTGVAVTPAAISGGEAPTEAEFNALRAHVAALRAALVTFGILDV